MNDLHLTDVQLDLLVDGELPDREYRRVLAALDDEPGGWRRCAWAFLEAQALQRELGELAEGARPQRGDAPPLPVRSAGDRPGWPLWLAMAGSFLLAFTLGTLFSRPWQVSPPPVGGPPDFAENVSEKETVGVPDDSAAVAPAAPERSPAIDEGGPAFAEIPPSQTPEGVMTFVFEEGDNETRRVELPYYRYDERQALRWPTEEPELPVELVRALRRMGHDLRQRRQLLPVDLEDGSRVVFPVNEVEIVPVGGRAYQ
jgi:hypothetical protein